MKKREKIERDMKIFDTLNGNQRDLVYQGILSSPKFSDLRPRFVAKDLFESEADPQKSVVTLEFMKLGLLQMIKEYVQYAGEVEDTDGFELAILELGKELSSIQSDYWEWVEDYCEDQFNRTYGGCECTGCEIEGKCPRQKSEEKNNGTIPRAF